MPKDIRIIRSRDFVVSAPKGTLDLEKSKTLLMEVASASTNLADYEIILDTRKTQSGLSVTDLWYLATELSNYRKAFSRKTAVLTPLEEFDNAEFFALCAKNRGFQVRAFTTLGEALEWLLEG